MSRLQPVRHLCVSRHSSHSRRGTVLLLCIVIVVVITALAAGFVNVTRLHRITGADSAKYLLAREAALMGRNHAIEQIVRGYTEESLTRLDGPAFAPFQSLVRPYQLDDLDVPVSQLDRDDRTATDPNFTDVMCYWGGGDFKNNAYPEAWTTADGRGRYIEPEFYNLAHDFLTPAGGFATTQPGLPVVFGTTATVLPDRHQPLLLNDRLFRLSSDPLSGRILAHYRLRYQVDVMDLDGQLLMNPDPAIEPDRILDPDPAALPNDPITLAPGLAPTLPDNRDVVAAVYPRIIRSAQASWNMHFAWSGFGNMEPNESGQGSLGRDEHVFLGRGLSNNFDQRLPFDHAPVAADYAPVTFPLMYRGMSNVSIFKISSTIDASPIADQFLISSGLAVQPAGGLILPGGAFATTPSHALTGPQYSFRNADTATYSQGIEGVYDYGTMGWGSFTPFGRGVVNRQASVYKEHPAASYDRPYSHYYGDVDVPWSVNPLTAPGQVLMAMIIGYYPPGVLQREYSYAFDTRHIGGIYYSDICGVRDLFIPQLSPAFARYQAPSRTLSSGAVIAPDYHLPGNQPSDNGPVPGADGAIEQRAGYRTPEVRYPGPVAFDGFIASGGSVALVHDDLGHYLRLKSHWVNPGNNQVYALKLRPPRDPVSGQQLWLERQWSGRFPEIPYNPTNVGQGQPLQWNLNDLVIARADPDTFWAMMGQAACAAVTVARGQWQQFASGKATPTALFSQAPDVAPVWGPWPGGGIVHTVADLDRLFLANLGIDMSNPSSQSAIPVWGAPETYTPIALTAPAPLNWGNPSDPHGQVLIYAYTPDYTIASLAHAGFFTGNAATLPNPDPTNPTPIANPAYNPLLPTYTPQERAAVMELMLNDFRLSFFGSSPGYLGQFVPLDFDGDGKVLCSAYPPNPLATSTETQLHLDQYAAPGQAVTMPFSLTGCFNLERSHFYRILTRGEVWDNFLKAPTSECLLDSVLCVDPADESNDLAAPANQHPGRQYSTHLMYQRTWSDAYRGDLARNY